VSPSTIQAAGGDRTLEKIGAGTVVLDNVAYTTYGGGDATAQFGWSVRMGTVEVMGANTLGGRDLTIDTTNGSTGKVILHRAANLGASAAVANGGILELAFTSSEAFGNAISGAGQLIKSGTTTVTLTATNSLTGTASVLGGKLIVNGSIASGTNSMYVGPGATLAGNGPIKRPLVIDGSLEVGDSSAAAVSYSALTLNAGSTLYFELGAASDSIAMTGAFSVAGSSTLNLSYLTGFVNTADYTLMTYTSATGLADLHYAALPSNYALVETGTQLILDYTAPITPTNVDATWNVDADGMFLTDSNWTPSAPKTADSTAMFGSVVTTNCLVTVDAPVTLASMTFDNANSYTIAGSGITLSGTAVGIAVTNGSHTISAPVALTAATPVTVQAGAALTMGDISGSSDLTKAGEGTLKLVGLVTNSGITNVNAGTLIVNGTMDAQTAAVNVATSATLGGNGTINRPVVAAASAIIAPGESIGTLSAAAVTMQAGSLLDIQITDGSADRLAVAGTFDVAGDLKVTYSTSTVVASTQTYSVATFASVNGDFANVMVDAQYIGHNIGALYIAKGMDADSYDVTVKPFMAGDANLDGQVKIGDLVTLAQHWNQASGATWFDGDANGDGQIKIGDLVALAQNWNKTVTAGGAVPEPLTLTVLGLGGLAVLRRRSGR
jgi:autotransporter-associated beta strand protein